MLLASELERREPLGEGGAWDLVLATLRLGPYFPNGPDGPLSDRPEPTHISAAQLARFFEVKGLESIELIHDPVRTPTCPRGTVKLSIV